MENSLFKRRYMAISGYFYLGQGYSLGSLVLLLPLYIVDRMDKTYSDSVTLSVLIILPWYVKFIFGIISDNYPIAGFGRRKPYLIIATIFSFIGWTTLGSHNSADIFFYLSGLSLALGSALADSVVDGQIAEITPIEYSGRMQGVAWGSRGLGLGMAASISPLLVDLYSWDLMFSMAAIFGISISVIVLVLPQREYVNRYEDSKFISIIRDLYRTLVSDKRYMLGRRLAFVFLTGIALSIVPMLPIIMEREFGFSYTQIGIGSLFFAIGSLVGSILIGTIFDRFDNNTSYSIFSTCYATILSSGMIFLWMDNYWLELSFLAMVGIVTGGYESYQLKVIQESSSENHEGTIFSMYTSISNIGQFVFGGFILVRIAERFDLQLFIPLLLLLIPAFIVVFVINSFKFR